MKLGNLKINSSFHKERQLRMFKLNKNLKLGVATASTQIEGGFTDSNWNEWYRLGHIKDGSNPERANNHYNLYKEDIQLMSALGIECYRMSIEWSRIEPKCGEFDQSALLHYRDEIQLLQAKGIEVLLTLHHFNNPQWFEKAGGFLSKNSPQYFLEFVKFIIDGLGDIVTRYVTINEPNVFVTSAYYFGEFPPGNKSFRDCRTAMTNLAICHISAYTLIHDKRKEMGFNDTLVGYASHVRIFEPKNKHNPIDIIGAKLMEKFFQGSIDKCCFIGKSSFPLHKNKAFKPGKYYDFIGINYYARSLVKGFSEEAKQDAPHNDMGWEVYPEGLGKVLEKYYKLYNAPIYITENGTADRQDNIRAKFIYDHLKVIAETNVPVERYYHWTFIDNFEWMDGEKECFGLVALNYENQERTVRESGKFYSEIIKNHGITDALHKKYVK